MTFTRRGISASVLLAALLLPSVFAEEKPNVVIVLADDVSWSSFGCVDGGLYTHTPNIDKLASQGLRFTNFSCAVFFNDTATTEIYTGLLPPTSGAYANGSKLKGEFKNVVHYLGDLGYNVGLTGKTHFKNATMFEKVPGFSSDGNSDAPTWEMSGVKQFFEKSQTEDKPFCMVIASVHAHHPWTVGDESAFPLDKIVVPPHMVDIPITREALAKHSAEVEDLDDQVGATMKLLDDMTLADDTVLIFLSEQGTAMPMGKWSIYDYGTKALCVVRWPGKIKPSVTDAVAMYCDVVPTLVDLAGGAAPAVDGKSFLPVLKGEASGHREHAYIVHQNDGYSQRAIRNKEFKLIWSPKQKNEYRVSVMMDKGGKFFGQVWQGWLEKAKTDPDAQAKVDRVLKHPEFELYNVKEDPWELNNLAGNPEHSQKLAAMHAQLKADMKQLNDSFTAIDYKSVKREKKGKDEEAGRGKKADKKKAERKENRDKRKQK
jgi:uncharacterized sulfatase